MKTQLITVNGLLAMLMASAMLIGQETSITIVDFEEESNVGPYAVETVTVDREPGQYLGHPTTCLLEDGQTILCVYPQGHGRGPLVFKRSTDGGRNWSSRLPVPENWSTSRETPTLYPFIGPDGRKRLVLFSGLYPIRMSVSDDAVQFSPLQKIGDFGGIVAMSSVFPLDSGAGHYQALFHDDGRFISAGSKPQDPVVFTVYRTSTLDGGLSWSTPVSVIRSGRKHLCEPGVIRSPDRKQLACLMRENSRRFPSQIMFSQDEGQSWSEPRDLPNWLCGDRHTGKYLPDGRLFISFRCVWPKTIDAHAFQGDWVGWVGSYEDLVAGRDGDMFIRLQDNTKGFDCAYPGVEVLADGTIVTTTYGHWENGEPPFVMAIRLRLP